MKKKFEDYYLGLDIGTSSIGWAVTDKKYNILKFNGKSMWGVRLFDEADTAQARRLHRSERRRNDRKKQRINLLQELFAKPMANVDDKFFLRLKESKFWIDDKCESGYQKYTLFNDDEYLDSDCYEQYPTIYHLRKALISGDEKALKDLRLVYLACHNIIKNRGHFLFSGELVNIFDDIDNEIMELNQIVEDELGFQLHCNDIKKAKDFIKDKNQTITSKKKQLENLFDLDHTDKKVQKQQKGIIALLSGSKVSLKEVLNIDNEEDKKIQLSSGDFDENKSEYEDYCGEKIFLIEKIKAIYDWGILARILDGEQYLSYAKVKSYEKHKENLKLLKDTVRKNIPEEYNYLFRAINEKDNYCAYIGSGLKNGKKYSIKQCSKDDLYKKLKKVFKDIKNDENVDYILSEIEKGTFLPKQISKDNGVIPNQIHKNELNKILDNASEYWCFLEEKDKYGTVKNKIVDILNYKIPYYVGPLNTNNSEAGFSWAVKRTNDKIYPWNYSEVVDEEQSAEEFIKRMTNKCVYLSWADVLPKNSIYYQGYMVLNELNNLRINDKKLSVEAKQDLFENLFKKQKNVTNNQILGFLKRNGYLENKNNDEYKISGIDGSFKASLSTYYVLSSIFKNNSKISIDVMEQIVFYATIFGEEKGMLVNRINNYYGDIISEKEIKQLKGLNFRGWGNFSKEFLLKITDVNKETGEYECILKALYNRQDNLQQLLSNEYNYTKNIGEANKVKLEVIDKNITYEDVEKLYVSPAIRRAIWQTVSIINEIKSITDKEPTKIFIEMARGAEEKKRTKSRLKKIENTYSKMKKDIELWKREEVLNALKSKSEEDLRSKKLYLWFTQLGKCMYSGTTINLEDLLYNNNKYDIDHIYPQSKVEDDSMDNKVWSYVKI